MSESKAIAVVEPKDFYIELERRDQQQIVMAALGEVADELFYEVHGKKSLSFEGINTAAFFIGDIEVDDWVQWERIEMFDRFYWSATVRARNKRFGLASLGTAEAPEYMDVYDRDSKGQKIPDPDRSGEFLTHLEPDEFCRRKALSKAQRNGKRAVMPTAVLAKWLQYFVDLKLYRKAPTIRDKPVMPFKPKNVDAEYEIIDTSPEKNENGDKQPEKPVEPKKQEKPGKTPTEPETVVAPSPPESKEQVEEYLGNSIIGIGELVKFGEYDDNFRVVRQKFLDKEIEDQIDRLIERMGGHWDNDNNYWVIPKED